MSNWIHRLFNPHCPSCETEKVCISCETLKEQLARGNEEKRLLLESLLETVRPKVEVVEKKEIEIPQQKFIPWRVKREMLEAEDRQKAIMLKKKQDELATDEKVDVSDLEKEMDIVAKEREDAG